jgi:predicted nucleotidyltransferase
MLLNEISTTKYKKTVKDVCDTVYDVLKRHCGPRASHAAWPSLSHTGEMTDMTFSKDGISIVRHLKFKKDSLEDSLKSSIAYVGTRVDNVCHDGTTTSMMLFTSILRKVMSEDWSAFENNYSYKQIESAFHSCLGEIKERLNECSFTPEELTNDLDIPLNDVRKLYAYVQAYIASKGNTELATAISEIVEKVPVEKLFGQYVRDVKSQESDIAFEVVEDAEFSFEVFLSTPGVCNDLFKTEYEKDTVDLLVSEDPLTGYASLHDDINSALKTLLTFNAFNLEYTLENAEDEDHKQRILENYALSKKKVEKLDTFFKVNKDLVILASKVESSSLLSNILEYNKILLEKGYRQIVLINLLRGGEASQRLHLRGLRILARNGEVRYLPGSLENDVIKDVKVHYYGRRILDFWNVIPKGDDPIFNPWYVNLKSAPSLYQETIKELTDQINKYMNTHEITSLDATAYQDYLVLYRYMICRKQINLQIGGSTHSARAMLSVVDDAYGAAVSALNNGIVFDGLSKIERICNDITLTPHSDLEIYIASILQTCLQDILTVITGETLPSHTSEGTNAYYQNVYDIDLNEMRTLSDKESVRAVITAGHYQGLLMQPIVGYNELLKRIEELIPKYLSTTTFLNSHDVSDNT